MEESPEHCNQNESAVDSEVQEIIIMDGNGLPHEKLSRELYGSKLAEKVVNKLIEKLSDTTPYPAGIHYSHRDYCGIGIFYFGKGFSIHYVFDSMPQDTIVFFRNEQEMISFLANQSDYSMSGYDKNSVMKESDAFQLNNQRNTRKLLLNFLSKK